MLTQNGRYVWFVPKIYFCSASPTLETPFFTPLAFFLHLLFFFYSYHFLNFPSIPCSRGPIRRRGSGSSPGAAGPSGWRRWCWGGSRCPTPSPFTLTLVPPSANTASDCWRVSFARACSVKVGLKSQTPSGDMAKMSYPNIFIFLDNIYWMAYLLIHFRDLTD